MRIQGSQGPRMHPIVCAILVAAEPDRHNLRMKWENQDGQGKLGRQSNRGEQGLRGGGREPIFPRGGRGKGISETEQSHYRMSVEGHRALLPPASRWHAERQRSVVLPAAESRGRGD